MRIRFGVVTGLLLGLAATVVAEDLTISTYYPSPRGVYQELRTTNNAFLATQGGAVGIGTIGPLSKLDVNGGVAIGTYAGVNAAPNNGMIVSGNVGIGTTNPGGKLEVGGEVSITGGSGSGPLSFTDGGVKVVKLQPSLTGTNGGQLTVQTKTDNGGLTDRVTITNAGNVGIGTTDPKTVLHVKSPSGHLFTRFEGVSNSFDSTMYISSVDSGDGGFKYYGSNLMDIFSYGDLRFDVGPANLSGTIGNQRMVITQLGNVGIGTITPNATYLLDVNGHVRLGNGGLADTLVLEAHDSYNHLILRNAEGEDRVTMSLYSGGTFTLTNHGYPLSFDGNGHLCVGCWSPTQPAATLDVEGTAGVILNAGNVGIGTTDPGAYRLNVAGDIHASGTISVPSDARFKTHIEPLQNILPKLDALHSISYEKSPRALALGQPASGKRELGVVGQELEEVFPELVSRAGPEEYRAVDYSRLSVVLLEAVKELSGQNQLLQGKNRALERRIMALEADNGHRRHP